MTQDEILSHLHDSQADIKTMLVMPDFPYLFQKFTINGETKVKIYRFTSGNLIEIEKEQKNIVLYDKNRV